MQRRLFGCRINMNHHLIKKFQKSGKSSKVSNKTMKWAGKGIRLLIGMLIFFFVFKNIDFAKLKFSLIGSNPWLILLGLLHFPILIIIAVSRWRFVLGQYHKVKLPFNYAIKHYWIGLALGFLTPASLGLDAYRVGISGHRYGDYTTSTVVVLVEKLMALITCMLIIVVLYPIVPITPTPQLRDIFYLAYILLLVSGLLLLGIFVVLRNKMLSFLLQKFENYITAIQLKITKNLGLSQRFESASFSFRAMIEPIANPSVLLVIVFSFGIQFVSSLKSQVFFCALNYDLPFTVNLFVVPAMYFIFILPISFGSLGIREGVYILLYGLFGVPAEVALIVSFFNLSGILMNNLIGNIIMMLTKSHK